MGVHTAGEYCLLAKGLGPMIVAVLAAVAEHGTRALSVIEASACPVRADAAVVAAMADVSRFACDGPGSSGNYLWVASELNQTLAVLPEPVAVMARELRTEPGQSVLDDSLFLQTPYRRTEGLARTCAPARLDPAILTVSPADASHVIAVIGWGDYRTRNMPWDRAEMLFGYPAEQAENLLKRLRAQDGEARGSPHPRVATFDPCALFMGSDLIPVEICRDDPAP
jgi:hypothetical protein